MTSKMCESGSTEVRRKIRLSQAITTFSPGAMVDLPEDSVIIGGLDGWQYDRNEPEPIIECLVGEALAF